MYDDPSIGAQGSSIFLVGFFVVDFVLPLDLWSLSFTTRDQTWVPDSISAEF